jgi:hypothetical protein
MTPGKFSYMRPLSANMSLPLFRGGLSGVNRCFMALWFSFLKPPPQNNGMPESVIGQHYQSLR